MSLGCPALYSSFWRLLDAQHAVTLWAEAQSIAFSIPLEAHTCCFFVAMFCRLCEVLVPHCHIHDPAGLESGGVLRGLLSSRYTQQHNQPAQVGC